MNKKDSLILTNDLSELDKLGEWVEEFGEQHDFIPKMVFELNLALDEIVTNIISYGYEDEQEHEISIELSFDERKLEVVVRDDGKQFNPLDILPPDIEAEADDRTVGGLGVYFVRQLMDEVEYKWQEDHNILLLKKNYNESCV